MDEERSQERRMVMGSMEKKREHFWIRRWKQMSVMDRELGVAAGLSFLTPVGIVLAIFFIKGIYPFGDRGFLVYDMYHQYFPFFAELIRKLREGGGLFYSYHVGMGENFLALYVYYLASPLNWLGLLVPRQYLMEFLSYLAVFRIGLCGLTSFLYMRHRYEKKSIAALFFACFYALSGFMAAYNYNVMWLDCVVILPIIVLGLERLVKEGRCGLYCISLAFSILTNYYISILICIFLVLYFLTLLVTEKGSLRAVRHFAFYSLLAGGMACVLLMPEVCAMLTTDFGDMDFPGKLEIYFSILDELARHCMCITTERGLEHWPNIYCGTAVFFLMPMYVTNRDIPMKRRFCRLALAGIFLLAFAVNYADFVWHGLNFPDSLPARQSFLYIFLVLMMCYEAYLEMDRMPPGMILYGYLSGLVFLLFCEKFVENEDFEPGVIYLSILFMTIFAVLVYLKRTRKSMYVQQVAAVVCFAAVIAETGINTYNTSIGTISRTDYLNGQEDYRLLYEYTLEKEETGIYRIEKFGRRTKNDGTLAGYPSASVFSSTLNSQVMDLYKRLGMRHSKVYYSFDGATELCMALFNIHWMVGSGKDYSNTMYAEEIKSGNTTLYRVGASLPFGYVTEYGADLPEDLSAIRLQNALVQELGGKGTLFGSATAKNTGDDVVVTAEKPGQYYAVISASGTGKVQVIGGSLEEAEYGDLKKDCIIYLGYLYEGDSVTIRNGDDKDITPKVSAAAFVLNEKVLEDLLEKLREEHLENVVWDNTHIEGDVTLSEEGRMILSIPYEKGWRIRVDGERTEPALFGGVLMALDLPAGEHHVEMRYVPYGFIEGVWMSLISICVFALIFLWGRRGRKQYPGRDQLVIAEAKKGEDTTGKEEGSNEKAREYEGAEEEKTGREEIFEEAESI